MIINSGPMIYSVFYHKELTYNYFLLIPSFIEDQHYQECQTFIQIQYSLKYVFHGILTLSGVQNEKKKCLF